jgi:DNA replicative helicase MCM subunit Mcm2 (Cdc46/Mcm family)
VDTSLQIKPNEILQACTTVTSNQKVNGDDPNMEDSPQAIKERMSPQEWNTIYKMSQDKALYQNLITSLFPTIHGNEEVRLKSVSQPAVMAPRLKF